jgi:co-chaperonin GroES (HSP10)
MASDSFDANLIQDMEQAFPNVEAGIDPLGGRILVQLRRLGQKTKSGIVLVEDTKETAKWNNQVAKVIKLGPLAFRNRETREEWPEGVWANEGDYVRVPRWGGDRIEVPVKRVDGIEGEPVIFVVFNDHEVIAKVTGNPLEQRIYVL